MSPLQPDQRYSGYPRPRGPGSGRLAALASGQGRLFWVLMLFQMTNGFTKHMFGGSRVSFWVGIGVSLLIGAVSFKLFDKYSAGLGWNRLSAIGLAALLALTGPFWSFIGHGTLWAFVGHLVSYMTIVGLVLSKGNAELKRAGYVAPKGDMHKQRAALSSFVARHRELEAHPPVPENLFSGEGPASPEGEVHGRR